MEMRRLRLDSNHATPWESERNYGLQTMYLFNDPNTIYELF